MFMEFISCQFGSRPVGKPVKTVAQFGQIFPEPNRLAELPPAMRREAALLAEEMGLTAPKGALSSDAIVLPYRLEGESGQWVEDKAETAKDVLTLFCHEAVVADPSSDLMASDLGRALEGWCTLKGIKQPSSKETGAFMAARFERFVESGRRGRTGWHGVRLTA